MSFPSLKGGPFSGTYKEAWTNLRPSGSWLLAETVLVNSYSRVMGYFNGKNLGSLWFPAICYKNCQLSRHGDYLGLLIWLGFMLLGQIIRFLFRKWLSDSQNPSVNQKYSWVVRQGKWIPCPGLCGLSRLANHVPAWLPVTGALHYHCPWSYVFLWPHWEQWHLDIPVTSSESWQPLPATQLFCSVDLRAGFYGTLCFP